MNIKKIVLSKNKLNQIIKIYASVSSIITLAIAVYSMAFDCNFYTLDTWKIASLRIISCWLFFVCLTILIFKPDFWQLFSISHSVQGFLLIIGGEPVFGCIIFFVGCAMVIRNNFFRTKTLIKIVLVAVILSAANFLQYSSSVTAQFTIRNLLFFAACFTGSILLFFILEDYLNFLQSSLTTESEKKPEKQIFDLNEYNFNHNELYALAATLRDEPYYAISLYLAVSESVVKKMMLNIYAKFGCKNRELFIDKISRYQLVYPEWFKLPE